MTELNLEELKAAAEGTGLFVYNNYVDRWEGIAGRLILALIAEVEVSRAMGEGVRRIAAERRRQVDEEGWTAGHDREHSSDDLARAAACYALPERFRFMRGRFWPWGERRWKPTPGNRIRELEKAGALIAAELDRLASPADATRRLDD